MKGIRSFSNASIAGYPTNLSHSKASWSRHVSPHFPSRRVVGPTAASWAMTFTIAFANALSRSSWERVDLKEAALKTKVGSSRSSCELSSDQICMWSLWNWGCDLDRRLRDVQHAITITLTPDLRWPMEPQHSERIHSVNRIASATILQLQTGNSTYVSWLYNVAPRARHSVASELHQFPLSR